MSAIYAIARMMSSPADRKSRFMPGSAFSLPWLLSMGRYSALLSALPLLLATPALAQQQEGAPPVFNLPGSRPQTDQERQGPELDVFRGAPAPATQPPVVVPPITIPPAVTPAQPTPRPENTTAQPAPTPTRERTAPAPAQGESRPAPETPPAEQATPSDTQAAPSPAQAPTLPKAQPAPAPEPAVPLQPTSTDNSWMWIAGAAALVLLLLAAFLFRRRNSAEVEEQDIPVPADERPSTQPAVEPTPSTPEPAAPIPPAPTATPRPTPTPPPVSSDRPWIDLNLDVRSARFSLMGATISYTLTLSNRGEQAAEDILVRSVISNADANQHALLQQFFTGSAGLPVHSVVTVAPGESQSLTGELRLAPDQIAPVKMGERALLIPLVAFDAQYRWGVEDDAPSGSGRTGRAFIIGQEQTPPTDRLAPFRLDLGPRQFRAPASRATALALAS